MQSFELTVALVDEKRRISSDNALDFIVLEASWVMKMVESSFYHMREEFCFVTYHSEENLGDIGAVKLLKGQILRSEFD